MRLFQLYTSSFKGLSKESWILAVVMLINRSGSMVLPFLGVYMSEYLNFSLKNVGLVLSFFGIGSVVGSWLGGWITDKIGEFRVQFLSLLLSVPLFCLIPLFKTEASLALIIFLQSTVSESFRPANSVAITKYARKGNITRSFSLNRMAVNLGFSIGPALGGILAMISYDFLFYTNALAALLAGIIYILFFKKRNYRNKQLTKKEKNNKINSPYRDSKFILFCLFCFLFSICFFQLLNTLILFYKIEANLPQTKIGYLLAFSGLVIVLLEMLLVQIAEKKFSLRFTLFIGTILCAISFGMLSLSHHFYWLILSMTILCIGEIWALPFMSTVTALRSGENNKGTYMGMLGIGFSLSFILTPFLGTQIAEKAGFNTLWVITSVVFTLSAVGFYWIIPKMTITSK